MLHYQAAHASIPQHTVQLRVAHPVHSYLDGVPGRVLQPRVQRVGGEGAQRCHNPLLLASTAIRAVLVVRVADNVIVVIAVTVTVTVTLAVAGIACGCAVPVGHCSAIVATHNGHGLVVRLQVQFIHKLEDLLQWGAGQR